jgi:hypothetical protein
MNRMSPRILPRRTPETGEAGWQRIVSGWLFVDNPDPFDPEPDPKQKPTPAHIVPATSAACAGPWRPGIASPAGC